MSGDGETDVVMKGITHGACDYIIKPVRLEELRNIWQHVVRKRVTPRSIPKEESSGEWDDTPKSQETESEQTSRKRKENMDEENQFVDDVNNLKKARVVWSPELHKQFVTAVNQLGVDSKSSSLNYSTLQWFSTCDSLGQISSLCLHGDSWETLWHLQIYVLQCM